jgi:hypothetical protein
VESSEILKKEFNITIARLHVHRPPAVTLNETPEEFHISTGLCQKIQIKFTARGLWTRTLVITVFNNSYPRSRIRLEDTSKEAIVKLDQGF